MPAWAQASALGVAALALALALFAEPFEAGPGLAFLAPALVVALAALQCVPLPALLVRTLAPVSWQLRSFAPAPAQAWAPLSLDLPATLGSLALPLACACAAAAAGILARRTGARLWLCAAPLVAALLQAAIAFSRFEPGLGSSLNLLRLLGSFVNRNHQAALFSLGALIALGAALEARSRKLLWVLAAAACGAGSLLTLSRGGALALGLGALILLALRRRRSGLTLAAAVIAASLAASLWLSSESLQVRFKQLAPSRLPTETKLRSFIGAGLLVKDHWLTGVGRGAWQFLSERHRSVPGEVTFYYVENEPLQLAADLGVPAALAVLALLALAWLRAARRSDLSGLEQGALAGLCALFAQNLVDFDLELLGVALPTAVALGALQAGEGRRMRALLVALLVSSPLAAWALFAAQPHSAEADAARLLAIGDDHLNPADLLEEAGHEAVVRHPADWLVSLAPALGLYQRTPQRTGPALAWAGRAMLLAPFGYRPHATAAAILLRAGRRSQARVETRLALSGEHYSLVPWEVVGLAARASRGLDELRESTPEEPSVRAKLVERLHSEGRLAEARELAEAELPTSGTLRPVLLEQLAAMATESHDPLTALRFGDQLAKLGDACAAARWRSPAYAMLGRSAEAEAERIHGLAACPGDRRLGEDLVRSRLARGDPAGALLSLGQLDAERPGSVWAADAHLLHAEVFEALHRPARAQAERFLAAELAPERPGLALDYANRLAAGGDRAGAREALRSLAPRAQGPDRAQLERRLTELEQR